MNKEYLEALEWLLANEMIYRGRTQLPISPALRDIKQYLEAIDNAKFSKSLEELKKVRDFSYRLPMVAYLEMNYALDTIQDALVKAQEQEKVLKIIKQKNVDIRTLKECFKTDYGFQEYNKHQYEKDELTQEEFVLLKRYFYEQSN